jgi:general secretion pathway protein E
MNEPLFSTEHASSLESALLSLGLIDQGMLGKVHELCRGSGQKLSAALIQSGALSQDHLYLAWSQALAIPIWDGQGGTAEALPFDAEFCRNNLVLPIIREGKPMWVLGEPDDEGLSDLLQRQTPGWGIYLYPANRLAVELQTRLGGQEGELAEQAVSLAEADIGHLKDLALEAPIIRLVNDMITEGVEMGASDIHIEPFKHQIELRYRVDGVLHTRQGPRLEDYAAVVSRIKILAELDIAERRVPQDGRIRTRAAGREVDIRVSTIPARHGEDVVLRLLDQRGQSLTLESTHLSEGVVAGLRASLVRSNGLVLVTGPTGSGKTTTLYSAIREVVDGRRKIITVEDPVEYEIPSISQIQLNSSAGMTFANSLRAILRHDPDIIFVGEIRDRETADLAVQSSLTGHLVLSTIHTNSAVGAISRFLDMGVPDYLLASSLIAITAQRLVRRLCRHCVEDVRIDALLAARLGLPEEAQVPRAVGCHHCAYTGYQGRFPIAELLLVDDALRHEILKSPDAAALAAAAHRAGFSSMLEDGLSWVRQRQTTIEEILRVAG